MEQTQDFRDVMQRAARSVEYTKHWYTNIERWRSLYNQKHYQFATKDTQFNDPTHINTVDLAVGIMLANKTRWHAYGITPSHKEQHDTGRIEKLIEAMWDRSDEREEKSNMYELFLNFVRDGGGVIYSVFNPEIAKNSEMVQMVDEEEEGGVVERPVFHEIPVTIQIIDPRKIFVLPGGPKRWLMIGRKEEMSYLDINILYPDAVIERMGSMSDEEKAITKGDFMDIWDYITEDGELKIRNTVTFAGQPVLGPRIMKGYKELAYTIQLYKPTTASPEGWHNIMLPMESSVELLEKTINRRAKQIDIYTALPLISKTKTGRVVQVDASLFGHVNIGTDESIEFPNWPGNAPDVQLHIEFLRTRVNQSGFSDVMFGGSGEAAGYAMSQMGDMNRIRMEQPIKHLELLLTSWSKKALDLMLAFGKDYYLCIYGTHKGKDFNEYVEVNKLRGYAVKAEIRASYPAEETRKVAMGSQSKGLLSDYTIMERFFDIEQPEDEQERKMIEAASAHPLVIEYSIIAEITKMAEDGDPVALKVLKSMEQAEGAKSGADSGRSKDPVSQAGYSNVASADGSLTPQEQGGEPAGQSASDQLSKAANNAPKFRS